MHRFLKVVMTTLAVLVSGCGSQVISRDPSTQPPVQLPNLHRPSVSLAADPASVVAGEAATLYWRARNTTSCRAAEGWSGRKATIGQEKVGPLDHGTNFSIACTGPEGSATDGVYVALKEKAPLAAASDEHQMARSVIPTVASGQKGTPALVRSMQRSDTSVSAQANSQVVRKSTGWSLPADAIAGFGIQAPKSARGAAFTIGLPLGAGKLPSGANVVVTDSSGQPLKTQWNPLTHWRTDHSQLLGALTFELATSGSPDGRYYVKRGDALSGSPISKADLVAAGFDASVSVVVKGVTYRLDARDLLDGSIKPLTDYTEFTGPLASEFEVGGLLRKNGTGETISGGVKAYFYLRAFNRPVDRVYATVVLENTGAFDAIADLVADSVDVKVAGKSIAGFPKTNFTIHADVRYQKRAWWPNDPGIWVQRDVERIQDTKLVPEYRDIQISENALAGFPQTTDWNERHVLQRAVDAGGARPSLAPYDRWTAAYLMSADPRAWNAMRAAQDEYAAMVNSSADALYRPRDEHTGFAVDLAVVDRTSLVWGNWWAGAGNHPERVFKAHRDTVPQSHNDIAHQPAIGYVLYLLTAETNVLENLQLSGVEVWINTRPGGYNGTIPNRKWGPYGQIRSFAWAFRQVTDAGLATPDNHPLKPTLQAAVGNAISQMAQGWMPLDPQGKIGLVLTGPGTAQALAYGASETPTPNDSGTTGLATWMDDWVTWAIGSAYERGWKSELDVDGLWAWKAQAAVVRFGTTTDDYCWQWADTYALGVKDTSDGPLYSSWAEIFDKNWPDVTTCAPAGAPFGRGDDDATSFGAQIAGGLSEAVSTGIAGAQAAWTLFDSRATPKWEPNHSSFAVTPEWALMPRDASGVTPPVTPPVEPPVTPPTEPPVTPPVEPPAGANPTLADIPANTAVDLGAYTCTTQPGDTYCAYITDYSRLNYDAENHQVLMFGGGHASTFRDDVDVFNLSTLKWSPAYAPTPCKDMTPENYDQAKGIWTSSGHPLARHTYDMMVVAKGQLIMMNNVLGKGGCAGSFLNSDGSDPYFANNPIQHYDIKTKTWTQSAVMAGGHWHYFAAAEYDPISQKVIVAGVSANAGAAGLWAYEPFSTPQVEYRVSAKVPNTMGGAQNLVYYPPNGKLYFIKDAGEVYEITLNRADPKLAGSTVVKLSVTGDVPTDQETGYAYDDNAKVIGGAIAAGKFYTFDPMMRVWTSYVIQSSTPVGTLAFQALDYDSVDGVYIFITDKASGRHTWAYRPGP